MGIVVVPMKDAPAPKLLKRDVLDFCCALLGQVYGLEHPEIYYVEKLPEKQP